MTEQILSITCTLLLLGRRIHKEFSIRLLRFLPGLFLGLLTFAPLTASSYWVQELPDLSGNWIRSDFANLGQSAQPLDPRTLTVEGQRQMEAYNFLIDDPAFGCVPASWTRVWSNPNVVVQIEQSDGEVSLRYEWMDINRRIPLVDPGDAEANRVHIEGMPTLGGSLAWYDADTLVIDTTNYSPGYVSTIADLAGLPLSSNMHTVERIRRQEDALTIEITHLDSTILREPFVITLDYAATDYELLEYGCTPDDASLVAPD